MLIIIIGVSAVVILSCIVTTTIVITRCVNKRTQVENDPVGVPVVRRSQILNVPIIRYSQIARVPIVLDQITEPSIMAKIQIDERNKHKLLIIISNFNRKTYYDFKLQWFNTGKKDEAERSKSCSICLDDFKDDTILRETTCHHYFHDECLIKWIAQSVQSPSCPYCKS